MIKMLRRCPYCGADESLIVKKTKINNIDVEMVICPRCNGISFYTTKKAKLKLFEAEAKKEEKKAIKEIIKDAN